MKKNRRTKKGFTRTPTLLWRYLVIHFFAWKKGLALAVNTNKGVILSRTRTAKLVRGFTLLEIIVAVGVFAVLSVFVAGTATTLTSIHTKTRLKEEIRSELRFALDTMGREITWGIAFPDGCEAGCTGLTFVSQVRPDVPEKEITYSHDGVLSTIFKKEQKTFGACSTRPVDDSCKERVLSDNIIVDTFAFYILNTDEHSAIEDIVQSTITVTAKGRIILQNGKEEPFNVTSSFSPRLIQKPSAINGGGGMVTPILTGGQQCAMTTPACSTDNLYRAYLSWVDDARHWMHIWRCTDSSCSDFVYKLAERDSSVLASHNDNAITGPGTYYYKARLHDHVNDPGSCGFIDPVTGTCGPFSNILPVTLLNPPPRYCSCGPSGGGGGGGNRVIIPGPDPGGTGGGGAGGER